MVVRRPEGNRVDGVKGYNKPSSSPKSPRADLKGVFAEIVRLNEVSEITEEIAEIIAMAIFEVLAECDDEDVLSGNVDLSLIDEMSFEEKDIVGVSTLKQYLKILNDLFRLAGDTEFGSLKHLDRNVVESFDIGIVAKARVLQKGDEGNNLLDILCEIVNQELKDRRPKPSMSLNNRVEVSTLGGSDIGRDHE